MRGCRAHINIGRNLIIYPEGTRSTTGEMSNFKNGAALIAAQLGLTIVPAHIDGTFKALSKKQHFIRPNKIHIRFGEKIDTKSYANNKDHKVYAEITEQLANTIRALKEHRHEH